MGRTCDKLFLVKPGMTKDWAKGGGGRGGGGTGVPCS